MEIEKAILAELEPGKSYFMAIRRGNIRREQWQQFAEALAKKDITVYPLETYDNPAECILFNARKEETVTA